jgi:precorrin-8X/cobalt-precorrin-8 methylmutase
MTGILLLGHGSRQAEATQAFHIASKAVSSMVTCPVNQAVLSAGESSVSRAVAGLVDQGAKKVLIVPVFLFEGTHVKFDIPEILDNLKTGYPDTEFKVTDCFGVDGRIVDIILSRIKQFAGDGFVFEHIPSNPVIIEQESVRKIGNVLDLIGPAGSHPRVVNKVVHTVGDLSIMRDVYAPREAVEAGVRVIQEGKNVVTDVEMVRAGIRAGKLASFGGEVFCLLREEWVRDEAERAGKTRTATAIGKAAGLAEEGIIAIGNAPTALFEVCRMLQEGEIKPALVIGTPVGFVGCAESKQALMGSGVKHITIKGTRGGSACAAAIVNTLIDLASE